LKIKLMKKNITGLIIYFNPKHDNIFSNLRIMRKFTWYNLGLFKEECRVYEI